MTADQNIKLIITEDGSHSLALPELEETYHSTHGATQESNHVFIEAGLKHWLHKNPEACDIKILEFGFGTGLNVLLTASNMPEQVRLYYNTIEKHPLSKEVTGQLNYGETLNGVDLFNQIHNTPWGEKILISPSFSLRKVNIDFRDFTTDSQYNLIYFDAFAPSKQPELWTKDILSHCFSLLANGGVFVTYSAKGQLKRDLKEVGFRVESLPGPPGKFQITRAIK